MVLIKELFMNYIELNNKVDNIDDENIKSAFHNLINTCIKSGMTADETINYVKTGLKVREAT